MDWFSFANILLLYGPNFYLTFLIIYYSLNTVCCLLFHLMFGWWILSSSFFFSLIFMLMYQNSCSTSTQVSSRWKFFISRLILDRGLNGINLRFWICCLQYSWPKSGLLGVYCYFLAQTKASMVLYNSIFFITLIFSKWNKNIGALSARIHTS